MKKSGKLSKEYSAMSLDELKHHYFETSEQHIIAGLITSVQEGKSKFEEIIANEFYRIPDAQARQLYLSTALVHAIGALMPATLATRIISVNLADYHGKFEKILDEIVLEDIEKKAGDLVFKTQHRVIAETLIDAVLINPAKAVELIIEICRHIDPHNRNEYYILRQLYQEEYLEQILKKTGPIRSCYDALLDMFPADPHIKQHYAIYESEQQSFKRAHEFIDQALADEGSHPYFLNTKANIWLKEALYVSDRDRAEYLLKKGTDLIRFRISKDYEKEIHFYSLIDKLLEWSKRKDFTEEQRLRILEDVQADIDDALRLYPYSSDLLTLNAKLNLELKKIPDAASQLARSIKLDEGNTRARLLLARILYDDGNYDKALEHVDAGLSYSKSSGGLLWLRLKCCEKLNRPWPNIKSAWREYLHIVEGNFKERIRYAKRLIEEGDKESALSQIDQVRNGNYSFSDKINTYFDLEHNGKPMIAEGVYHARRIGNGYVHLDGFPKKLGAFLNITKLPRGYALNEGKRIKCRLGINGLGLVVIGVI
jgi:tetratricopeptide (TPR) repeat protein